MEPLERILKEHPIFEGLAKRHLELITGCASNVRFNADQFIFREDEEASRFYLIRQGKVALETFVPGRGAITIQTLNGGEVVGWSWLVPPYRTHFDAKAVEPTRAIALDGKCLREHFEEDHDLGYELIRRFAQIMEQRLMATRWQLVDIYGNDVNGR